MTFSTILLSKLVPARQRSKRKLMNQKICNNKISNNNKEIIAIIEIHFNK